LINARLSEATSRSGSGAMIRKNGNCFCGKIMRQLRACRSLDPRGRVEHDRLRLF
jgi:hypothetical protein